ncbi:MAG: SpoIIE family protein phosphatase [Clostridiales bacterium]|nr:SpoIIE family protein phosphatase [Clostridiales bacterium]
MMDWVRVIDMSGSTVYMNKAMKRYLQHNACDAEFHEALRQAHLRAAAGQSGGAPGLAGAGGQEFYQEIKAGSRVLEVISSPQAGAAGETEFIVEVFRDVTRLKNFQKTITEQNGKFESDLDMAKMLQRKLLPSASPNPGIEFSYLYEPCTMLGGDFVDIYNIGSDHLGVYIADVSGHGVSAAILTVFLRSTISKRMTSPAEALNTLYWEYNKNYFESEAYITVFYAIYDLKNGVLTYSNAGHNATPILYNRQNKDSQAYLKMPGLPISNWMDEVEYTERSVPVSAGDVLFLYTDGLSEIKNGNKDMFGQANVNLALQRCPDCNHMASLDYILKSAYSYADITDKSEQMDDITLSLVELLK